MKLLLALLILFSSPVFSKDVWKQWGLKKFDGDKVQKIWNKLDDTKVIVAVIDTGVDYNHPDLKGQLWVNKEELNGERGVDDDGNGFIDDIHGHNFADNNSDITDRQGHGTHVAGIIAAAHNDTGINGLNPNAEIMVLKSFVGKRETLSILQKQFTML